MSQVQDKKVGLIGLGMMGIPMAKNIMKANFPLIVYDVREEPMLELERLGAKVAKSPKQVGKESNTVIVMVVNTAQIRQATFPPQGAMGGMESGSTLIVMSTIPPMDMHEISKVATQCGISVLDAPVSGGLKQTEEGTLTIMVGGDTEIVRSNYALLKAMGKNIYHVGEVGTGEATKMVNQLLLTANHVALAEGMVMAKKLGLNLETLLNIVSQSSGDSFACRLWAPRMIVGDFNFKMGGVIDILAKDSGIVVDTARELGIPLLVSSVAQQVYRMAVARGFGQEDGAALVKIFEEFAGVRVCNGQRPG